MPSLHFSLVVSAGAALLIPACTPQEMPEVNEGRDLFMAFCADCHGVTGRGEGPMGRSMDPVPADLTLLSARNGGELPESDILSKIDGYAHGGTTGPSMPQFGDFLGGDPLPYDTGDGVLTPTPRKLVALIEYLETIQVASF
ncbi:c-type cytochrome [Marivita geojedonensis]|uniref:Cytochrome C n=1 Tax=Marivita geojedonensis TaxID=1123756 RepID=A0A1X4N894_9RHOB|nr:c-type cytochrome [Marivita geojedonensis]OSQ42469.1 cytochrome C [Marivita geojedonensis]PRY71415.1 cytochrome c [Marivita geojedonensis]